MISNLRPSPPPHTHTRTRHRDGLAGAGESIYEQGGAPDGTFIILGGRVRVTRQRPDTRIEFVNEFGRGETLGEIEVLTQVCQPVSQPASQCD